MNKPERRLWGIDVIAGIYGVATLLLIWVFFNGSDVGRLAGMILAPICAVFCIGIAFRFNPVRIILLTFLGIALVGDGILIMYYIGALAEVFQAPANKTPSEELMKMPLRFGATLAMFFYLRRSDVQDAFRGGKMKSNGFENDARNIDG